MLNIWHVNRYEVRLSKTKYNCVQGQNKRIVVLV